MPVSLAEGQIAALAAAAVRVVPGKANGDIVILCEHGGKTVPAPWRDLGLAAPFLDTHFGSDIGAAQLSLAVAEALEATAVIAAYSRLFLDYNRKTHDPDAFRLDMGGIPVPGNLDLGPDEIALRERIARTPVETAVARLTETARARAIISIHSFSPVWQSQRRSCEIGVMWREDARLPPALVDGLQRHSGRRVEDNQPYDFRSSDWYTLERHGLSVDVPCAYIEVRNDFISTPEGIAGLAPGIADAIADAVAAGSL